MAKRRFRARTRLNVESLEGRTLLSSFGVGVKGISAWGGEPDFVDVRHNFLPWGSWDINGLHPDPNLKLTAQGYPLSTVSTYGFLTNYPDGTYQVSYQGTASLDFEGIGKNNGPFTLGSDGYYHGSITIDHSWYNGAALVLHANGLDPSHPLANLSIITPGYSSTQVYTNQFLKELQPFSELRFDEWMQTIGSTEQNWSDRVPADWFTSAGPGGVSFEDMIELSNESHKDMWLSFPALATTDFVTQLANLVYSKLDPGLNVYVEYSNETWNNSFAENAQVYAAGKANPIVNQSGDIIAQQTAYMTKVIGDIFKTAFGSESSRVLPVLGGWATQPNYNTDELQFLQQQYGSPSNSIYALAIAPYVDLASGTDVPGITMDQLFASAFQNLNTAFPQMLDSNLAVARSYNVGLVSYEGGQSFSPYNGINWPLNQQAQSDPRMYSFYQTMMQIWDQHEGSLFSFSALNDPFWGLLPSISSPGSPKWDGVISALLPAGDANLDGVVDSKDQAIVAVDQGVTGAWWEQGDFNHDGVVNQTDMAIVENKAGPIADPGLEQEQVGAGHFQYRPTGSPWTFSGNAGIAANNSAFTAGNPAAREGTQVAFLQQTGSFSQTTGNWVAGNYVLTFDAAQRGNYEASRQNFQVLVHGIIVGTFTPSSTSYKKYTTSMFTVGAGSHTITFQGLDSAGGDNTAFIDSINIA